MGSKKRSKPKANVSKPKAKTISKRKKKSYKKAIKIAHNILKPTILPVPPSQPIVTNSLAIASRIANSKVSNSGRQMK